MGHLMFRPLDPLEWTGLSLSNLGKNECPGGGHTFIHTGQMTGLIVNHSFFSVVVAVVVK